MHNATDGTISYSELSLLIKAHDIINDECDSLQPSDIGMLETLVRECPYLCLEEIKMCLQGEVISDLSFLKIYDCARAK